MTPAIKPKIYIKQQDLEAIKWESFRAMLIWILIGTLIWLTL